MYTLDKFFELMNFIYELDQNEEAKSNLDIVLDSIARSDKRKVEEYFAKVIDSVVYNTDDNIRLRKFMVNWYTSHRTLTTVQTQTTDVHSMPDDQLNEILKSFGYTFISEKLYTKPNFINDLVNLYKQKGSPTTIDRVLNYLGFTSTDVVEYYLVIDSSGELVFRSRKASGDTSLFVWPDVLYNDMVNEDPHWMLTKTEMMAIIKNNDISLPTNTPYFSFRPNYFQRALKATMSIINHMIYDQYINFLNPPEGYTYTSERTIVSLSHEVSLIELQTAIIYAFIRLYDNTGVSTSDSTATIDFYSGQNKTEKFVPNYLGEWDAETNTPALADGVGTEDDYYLVSNSGYFLEDIDDDGVFGLDNHRYWKAGDWAVFRNGKWRVEPLLTEIDRIISRYDELSERPISRMAKDDSIKELDYLYTADSTAYNPIHLEGTAESLITKLNPEFKAVIDLSFNVDNALETLILMFKDYINYILDNIRLDFPNLAAIMLGSDLVFDSIFRVLDFFKPLRARLAKGPIDFAYIIDNKIREAVILDDVFEAYEYMNILDQQAADSLPQYAGTYTDGTADVQVTPTYHNREVYDTGSFFDAGLVDDKNHLDIKITQTEEEYIYSREGLLATHYDDEHRDIPIPIFIVALSGWDIYGTGDSIYVDDGLIFKYGGSPDPTSYAVHDEKSTNFYINTTMTPTDSTADSSVSFIFRLDTTANVYYEISLDKIGVTDDYNYSLYHVGDSTTSLSTSVINDLFTSDMTGTIHLEGPFLNVKFNSFEDNIDLRTYAPAYQIHEEGQIGFKFSGAGGSIKNLRYIERQIFEEITSDMTDSTSDFEIQVLHGWAGYDLEKEMDAQFLNEIVYIIGTTVTAFNLMDSVMYFGFEGPNLRMDSVSQSITMTTRLGNDSTAVDSTTGNISLYIPWAATGDEADRDARWIADANLPSRFPYKGGVAPSSGMSACFWYKIPDTTLVWTQLLSMGSALQQNAYFDISILNDDLYVYTNDPVTSIGKYVRLGDSLRLTTGDWIHVSFTMDITGNVQLRMWNDTLQVYSTTADVIDGLSFNATTQCWEGPLPGNGVYSGANGTGHLNIGSVITNNYATVYENSFGSWTSVDGYMDEIVVFDRILTPQEMEDIKNGIMSAADPLKP